MRWVRYGFVLWLACALNHARGADAPVTLREDDASFTLANGIVTARIDKRAGTFSLQYKDATVIERGYWSQVGRAAGGDIGRFGSQRTTTIRLDPAKNGGERAEVSCRFGYDGKSAGLPCDVDLRFALGRGESALYTYGIWEHQAGYPGFSVGEARTAYKLNARLFDYLAIDAQRRGVLPSGADWDRGEQLNMKEARRIKTGPLAGRVEHKYDYSAILAETPAYGWISTQKHLGVWLINPSGEYLAGGPTKEELTGHLDVNPGGAPTLLNMWHGSHYGGSSLVVKDTEAWTKCVGPFLLYCNDQPDPDQLWHDALAKAKAEQQAWPYAWVSEAQYPPAKARGTVSGQLTIHDPLAPKLDVTHLHVGLAAAPYSTGEASRNAASTIDWQRDSKHYQFWTIAEANGHFTIPQVRAGTYTLYAFGDGVLGEFSRADITVNAGQTTDLGALTWTPVRHGRQLWEIGVADRSAGEFRHGDHYWQWGLYNEYPKEFPDDVNFTLGKSDFHTDWNYCQCPRADRPNGTPWTVRFDLPAAPRGRATLRISFAATSARSLKVSVNDQPAGELTSLPDTATIRRDGIRGYWYEREVAFDAALLKTGANTLKLTIPPGGVMGGIEYDYLRLELDEK